MALCALCGLCVTYTCSFLFLLSLCFSLSFYYLVILIAPPSNQTSISQISEKVGPFHFLPRYRLARLVRPTPLWGKQQSRAPNRAFSSADPPRSCLIPVLYPVTPVPACKMCLPVQYPQSTLKCAWPLPTPFVATSSYLTLQYTLHSLLQCLLDCEIYL